MFLLKYTRDVLELRTGTLHLIKIQPIVIADADRKLRKGTYFVEDRFDAIIRVCRAFCVGPSATEILSCTRCVIPR